MSNGKKRIFVSSMQRELATERVALRDYLRGDPLLSRFFDVFLFEDIPAADRRADEVYLAEVDRCSVYVGLFGNEYGYEDASGVSPTEREFDRATASGKHRLVFVKRVDEAARHPKMRALVHKAGEQLIRRRFGSISELQASLYASLVEYLEQKGLLRTAPFDAAACQGVTVTDLATDKLDEFLARAQAQRSYPLGPGTPLATALAHLNLLDGDTPNHAAVLLFGREPQRWLPTSVVKCLHFHGTEVRKPIPSHQVYRGTVFALVDQAVDFVMSKIDRTVGTRAQGNAVPITYELPQEAVAEAIVNAVAHRDYDSNASVQVMLFADRLEVWNPGELPSSLTPERLTRPHASIPHNPLLADPLFLARYIEQAGTGTLDMIALAREAGLKAPEFRQDGDQFVQTLWRPTAQVTAQAGAQEAQAGAQEAQAGAQEAQAALSPTDKAMLAACMEKPLLGQELLKAAGYSERTGNFKRSLDKLLTGGFVERTIPDKPTSPNQRYRLTTKGRAWLESRQS